MAAESDRSPFVEPLPARPNLEMQQKRAKELARAVWRHDADALTRLQALHPRPPAPDALTLADAQLVVARGYGFESWTAMKRKIESLTRTPVEQFVEALQQQDVDRVRHLLDTSADVRASINSPIWHFDARPVIAAKRNLPLLDLLLQHGADINLKSAWWAGPFGILEYDCTPEEAAPLIERGAAVDVFAASHLGMFDRLRELIDRDPSLVHGRGGDGKTPLHLARTVDIAAYLVDRGADVDARCVDHESRPVQYLVREAPEAVRYLVERGAWFDIFVAIGLGDLPLVDRCRAADPDVLNHRIGEGLYQVAHDGRHPATAEQIGDRRGDIYRWVFGPLTAFEAATRLNQPAIVARLLEGASLTQRLLAACGTGNRALALEVVAEHPRIVSTLTRSQQRLLVERVQTGDLPAVDLMLELGFDPHVTGQDTGDPLHWAAFLGDVALVKRLLSANPAINAKDATHGGTALGWAIFGSVHGWKCKSGQFVEVIELLIDAGETFDATALPTGREDVDTVLRRRLSNAERFLPHAERKDH